MPPIHVNSPSKPVSRNGSASSGKVSTPTVAPKPLARTGNITLGSMRKSKFRIPVLQVLADMAPGHGMPMSTLAPIIADMTDTKQQNMDYFASNLLQTCIGYIDRPPNKRYDPTLICAGFVAAEEIEVGDGSTETLYCITPAGRLALDGYLAALEG